MRSATSRARRFAGVGAPVVGAFMILWTLPAWSAWQDHSVAQLRTRRGQLIRERQDAGSVRALRMEHAALADELTRAEAQMLQGATPSAGAAALSARVSDAVAMAAIRLETLRAESDTTAAAYFVARVRGDVQGDLAGMASLLQFIENDSVDLVVRELQITQLSQESPTEATQRLHASFTIEALVRRVVMGR